MESLYKGFLHLKLIDYRTLEVNYSRIHFFKKYIDIRKKGHWILYKSECEVCLIQTYFSPG